MEGSSNRSYTSFFQSCGGQSVVDNRIRLWDTGSKRKVGPDIEEQSRFTHDVALGGNGELIIHTNIYGLTKIWTGLGELTFQSNFDRGQMLVADPTIDITPTRKSNSGRFYIAMEGGYFSETDALLTLAQCGPKASTMWTKRWRRHKGDVLMEGPSVYYCGEGGEHLLANLPFQSDAEMLQRSLVRWEYCNLPGSFETCLGGVLVICNLHRGEGDGSIDCMVDLGLLRKTTNVSRALTLFQRAADEDRNVNALESLALLHLNMPKGAPDPRAKSVKFFASAIEHRRDVGAMFTLARLLTRGVCRHRSGPRDDTWCGISGVVESVRFYDRSTDAREQGNALFDLASLLEADSRKIIAGSITDGAVDLYNRAVAGRGDVHGLLNLALFLKNEECCMEPEPLRAAKLFKRRIEETGNVFAMWELAMILENGGEGVDCNPARAVEYYSRSKEGGCEIAQLSLARLLLRGADGVEIDSGRTKELYRSMVRDGRDRNLIRVANSELGRAPCVHLSRGKARSRPNQKT